MRTSNFITNFVTTMKTILRKSVALFMALVVLTTTVTMTIDMHYCGDVMVDLAIFKPAQDCGMDTDITTNTKTTLSSKSCCSDQQVVLESQDNYQSTSSDLQTSNAFYIAPSQPVYNQVAFTIAPQRTAVSKQYRRPHEVPDFTILYQTFLI